MELGCCSMLMLALRCVVAVSGDCLLSSTLPLEITPGFSATAALLLPCSLSAKVPTEPAPSSDAGASSNRMDETLASRKPLLPSGMPFALTRGPTIRGSPTLTVPLTIRPLTTRPTPGTCGKTSSTTTCTSVPAFTEGRDRFFSRLRRSFNSGIMCPVTAEHSTTGTYPCSTRSEAITTSCLSLILKSGASIDFIVLFRSARVDETASSDAMSTLVRHTIVGMDSMLPTIRCSWIIPRISPLFASSVHKR
mmetsp:Transcript_36854/g.96119  ORF Transcript_36854/g.96119 Transcript_36854/m.96119 type:complete len:250 (+) Transcript_36854:701-1450(+)